MASRLRIRVPASDQRGLAALFRISDADMKALVGAIAATPPEISRKEYAARVAAALISQVTDISEADLAELVRIAIILHITRSTADLSREDFIDQVIQAMKETQSPELRPERGEWESFRQRLDTLLEMESSLGVVAKANELQGEYERTFHDARVLTDVRPIFRGDPPELTDYMLVVHQMKITYHEGRELKEFFIPLDADSIVRLKELLERAEQKAARLRARMGDTSLHVLEGEPE